MARALALAAAPVARLQAEMLRASLVAGCALALIAAGQALPAL
ncbi:hypothetical protein [Novosphingobium marinum]|nr:hypothetical protein [Novosphingobium marinum]